MKTKLLALFSLLALLLASTAALADGRPTGIRISRATSGGNMNVEIDVTMTDTLYPYDPFYSTVWLGNTIGGFDDNWATQYASNNFSVPLPWAVDWGDGSQHRRVVLFGEAFGPWAGTFSHTYVVPGNYIVRVGDAIGDRTINSPYVYINSGNTLTGHTRYVWSETGTGYVTLTFKSDIQVLGITDTAAITTGTGIPTTDNYGLIALALLLVGTGLLVFRKSPRTAP